jgi:hypothetical protein
MQMKCHDLILSLLAVLRYTEQCNVRTGNGKESFPPLTTALLRATLW